MTSPKSIVIGSTEYWHIDNLVASMQGLTKSGARYFLKNLRVPILYVGQNEYFLLSALEEAMMSMMQLGEKGFMAPGSDQKNFRKNNTDAYTEIPSKLLRADERKKVQGMLKEQRVGKAARRTNSLKKMLNAK